MPYPTRSALFTSVLHPAVAFAVRASFALGASLRHTDSHPGAARGNDPRAPHAVSAAAGVVKDHQLLLRVAAGHHFAASPASAMASSNGASMLAARG